jgi:hypothetical protein
MGIAACVEWTDWNFMALKSPLDGGLEKGAVMASQWNHFIDGL